MPPNQTPQSDEARDMASFQESPLCEVRDHLNQTLPADPGEAFFSQITAYALNTARLPAPTPWYHRVWRSVSRPYLVVATTLAAAGAAVFLLTWVPSSVPVVPNLPVNVVVIGEPSPGAADDQVDPFTEVDQLSAAELQAFSASLLSPPGPTPSDDTLAPDDAQDPLDALEDLDADELASLQASLQHF